MGKSISIQWKSGQTPKKVELVMAQELGLTRHQIRSAKFRTGGITIDGHQVRVCEYLKPGENLKILLEDPEEYGLKNKTAVYFNREAMAPADHFWKEMPDLIYEDDDLMIVNKPAGVVLHPSHGHYGDTLADRLQAYLSQKGEKTVIRPIGRLDKDTSGAVLFAKNQVAAARLWTAFSAEKSRLQGAHKEYLALVWGTVSEKTGAVEAPIGKCPGELNRMQVSYAGQEARTHYRVLHHFIRGDSCFSLVRFRLETGRTHQIRVHMAYMGHPLLGDPLYGMVSSETGRFGRAALHCDCIWLRQPFTGEWIRAVAPLAQDMKEWIGEDYGINDVMLY